MADFTKIIVEPMTSDQIKQRSVINIDTVDKLQSPLMGNINGKCETCQLQSKKCGGHYGHIDMGDIYVFNPLLKSIFVSIQKMLCLNCLRIAVKNKKELTKKDIKCIHCKQPLQTFTIQFLSKGKVKTDIPIFIKCTKIQAYNILKIIDGIDYTQKGSQESCILNPLYMYKIIQRLMLFDDSRYIAQNLHSLEALMINQIPVPPNSMRLLSNPQNQNHAMNSVYKVIVQETKNIPFVDRLFLEETEQNGNVIYHLQKLIVAVRVALFKDTSKNSKPQTKQLLLSILQISSQEPASCLSQSLAKYGLNRQSISSVRVNMCGRTVIVGNPNSNCDEVIIPQFFAEKLYVPMPVNNQNKDYLVAMILKYPEYPCAVRLIKSQSGQNLYVKENNKKLFAQQVELGDYVGVQLMQGMVVMVNRYPTLQEQSFTALRLKIDAGSKSLQFPLSIVKKMGADFDGDEMQVFGLADLCDQMEAINLYSISRQFITYETGTNLIGGAPNLSIGMYHLQKQKQPFTDGRNGIQIIQEVMDRIYEDKKHLQKTLSYDDGSIKIINGKIEKFSAGLADKGSQFLTYIWYHHSPSIAVQYVDNFIHLAFQANMISASTVRPNLFVDKKDCIKFTEKRLQTLQDVIDSYFNGTIVAPAGFPINVYFEKLYIDRVQDDVKKQQDLILEVIKTNDDFLDKYFIKNREKISTAIIQLGQQYDSGTMIYEDPYYQRTLACFPKFTRTPQAYGYITGDYINGLKQKEMFFHALSVRHDIYKAKTSAAIGGYFARRINQGAGNVYAGHNGVMMSDGDIVIATQYGCAGYDPRCYIKIPFNKHRISIQEFEKQYKTHPRYEEMLEIRKEIIKYEQLKYKIDPYFNGFESLVVPFKFDSDTVSEQQLDKIFSVRLCEKMGIVFKQIITAQVLYFYMYALFFLKVDNNSTYNLSEKYIQCLLQAGEAVGLKAALACSQPLTQSLLSAIHAIGGMMTIIHEERTKSIARFEELVIRNRGPVIVQFQLLDGLKEDYNITNQFISKHQTLQFMDLKPKIQIIQYVDKFCGFKKEIQESIEKDDAFYKQVYSRYSIQIRFEIKQLGYNNIDIELLIEKLQSDNKLIQKIIPIIQGDDMLLLLYMDAQIQREHVLMINTYLQQKQVIGNKLFYNLYSTTIQRETGTQYKFIANLTDSNKNIQRNALLSVYQIPGIDHSTVYCNSPALYEEVMGIQKARLSLFNELSNNLNTDNETKEVQNTHVKLLSDIITQTGVYSSFTRNQYRKEGQRDMISKFLFEQGEVFLSDEVKNPQKQVTNTVLNSCIFGTRAEFGSTISEIVFNQELKIQDHSMIQEQILE